MSTIPEDLKYTKEHEWVRIDGDTAIIGITDYAQESLGDITYVELPGVGESLGQGDTFGVVESVKAASDLYMPVSGEIIERNESLDDAPETVNSDPFGGGWMLKVRISNPSEVEGLLDAAAYADVIES
jgi:glycine cleavage system H protein